jgi:hypothetical protein
MSETREPLHGEAVKCPVCHRMIGLNRRQQIANHSRYYDKWRRCPGTRQWRREAEQAPPPVVAASDLEISEG